MRESLATSCGLPHRPTGVSRTSMRRHFSSASMGPVMPVSTTPRQYGV